MGRRCGGPWTRCARGGRGGGGRRSLRCSKLVSFHVEKVLWEKGGCRPFGTHPSALTAPLPFGNLRVLVGAYPMHNDERVLRGLYSSTVLFRLPAYMKFPSELQHADMHHSGVPPGGGMRAMGLGRRRSRMWITPSMEEDREVGSLAWSRDAVESRGVYVPLIGGSRRWRQVGGSLISMSRRMRRHLRLCLFVAWRLR